MTHPLLNQLKKLAGVPLAEGSEKTYKNSAGRFLAGMDMSALQVQKALTQRVLENLNKYSPNRPDAQAKMDAILEAIETLKAANASLVEGKLPDFLKKEDDNDAKKDDKKEEDKEKSEKKEDDKDSEKDDKKEESKEKSEKEEDDKDSKKDDKKEEDKEKSEKKEDDKDSKKDDKKEEKKDKEEKDEDDKDAKKDDKEEEKLKENADLLSAESLANIVSRIVNNQGFQDKVATASKEDSSESTKIDISDSKPEEMNDGKGLEKHNETGFKALEVPAGTDTASGLMVPNATNVGDKAACFKLVKESEEISGKIAARKYKMPKEVKGAIETRIKELHEAIAEQDDKGYNDNGGAKQNAVDALNQFLQNGSKEDITGIKESQVFLGTLMSPITNLLPKQLIDWLGVSLKNDAE